MILELRIHNIAIVDDLNLKFSQGLTILTGETGAGKSVIAGSLGLLMGAPNPGDLVREGEDLGFVEAIFDLQNRPVTRSGLTEMGICLENDCLLILRRELRPAGRDRVLINGLTSSLALLKRAGELLLSIQSQDQQRQLSLPHFACDLLDRCLGNQDLLEELTGVRTKFSLQLAELEAHQRAVELGREQLNMWQYQFQELSAANLDPEEEILLAEQIHFGRNARRLLETAGNARQILDEADPSVQTMLRMVLGDLRKVSEESPRLQAVRELLDSAEATLGEASQLLERYLDTCEVDPDQLDELEQRKALYEELGRKYARGTEELLAYRDILEKRISRQENSDDEFLVLQGKVETIRHELEGLAGELHRRRLQGAGSLSAQLEEILKPLGLPDIKIGFQVTLQENNQGPLEVANKTCGLTDRGCDAVELMVCTNPGEGLGPVAKVASGGERSRIFLGLSVLDGVNEESPLLLFDEIDAGLGMEGAAPVADLLQSLALQGQVLCITHLATVAARGTHHLKVSKSVVGKRTSTQAIYLTEETRIKELTRLLGGKSTRDDSGHQVAFARKLLFPLEDVAKQ